MNPQPTPEQAFRAYQQAKDNNDPPVTVDRLWRAYWEAVEREMKDKERAA